MQNSKQWIDRIMVKLFEAEDRYLDKLITEINQANSEIKKTKLPGFMHMGKRFIPSEFQHMVHRLARMPVTVLPTLAFALMDRANELTKHLARLDLDKSQIRQILFQQLYQCNDLQEIRDSLPECLIPLVPELRNLPRIVIDPLWLVRSNAHAVYQYHKVLPIIEFYAMSRMMY